MNLQYKSALKSGLLAGLIWACLLEIAGLVYLKLNFSTMTEYYNGVLETNPNALSGLTAIQYIYSNLETSTVYTFLMGVFGGSLIALLLVWTHPKIRIRRSYAMKGLFVALILWIVYDIAFLTFLPIIPVYQIFTTFIVSIFSGLIGGVLYSRFSRVNAPLPQTIL